MALASLFTSLGFWQLSRAHEKQILQQQFVTRLQAPAIPIEQLPQDSAAMYQPVSVIGHYDNQHNFLLDNKIHHHQMGYEVLTPFIQQGTQQRILVNRGWIPAPPERKILPPIPEASSHTLVGYIYQSPGKPFTLGSIADASNQWPLRLQALDISTIQQRLKVPLFPQLVLLSPTAADGFVREWKPINMPPSKHVSYAVQWFSFAAIIIIIYISLNLKRREQLEK